jgi:hypothetical protein
MKQHNILFFPSSAPNFWQAIFFEVIAPDEMVDSLSGILVNQATK